jgi:uncharacterized membrane protein YqhA
MKRQREPSEKQYLLERVFETILFQSRLVVLLAVIGSLVASILMFFKGAVEIAKAAISFFKHPFEVRSEVHGHTAELGHEELSIVLIASIDAFLFASMLLIFAMGIYELFISEIDPASKREDSRPNWLEIHSLDDLKNAVGKVILMILIVRLFESAVKMHYEKPLDLLFLGTSICLVSLALYLVHAGHGGHGKKGDGKHDGKGRDAKSEAGAHEASARASLPSAKNGDDGH